MLETVKYLLGIAGPSGYGSRSTAEQVTWGISNLDSITAIVTGATSGIGFETARVLAMRGTRLILSARNIKAGYDTCAKIKSEFPNAVITALTLDLSSLASVRAFVSRFQSLHLPLNLLINNAGRFPQKFSLSEDGFDMTFSTNYLGHFLLTKLLTGKMVDVARETGVEGRIVIVTSNIHTWFSGDGFEYLRQIADKKMYSRVVRTGLTRERDRFFTDIVFFLSSKLLKSTSQAAATTCYVATSPQLVGVSGKYFSDCNEASTSKRATDVMEASELWTLSEEMVGNIASSSVSSA